MNPVITRLLGQGPPCARRHMCCTTTSKHADLAKTPRTQCHDFQILRAHTKSVNRRIPIRSIKIFAGSSRQKRVIPSRALRFLGELCGQRLSKSER
jgi:hypothetical protein